MSTILDILKKLEEEKSVLEQGLDLKGMVLRREPPVYSRSDRARPNAVRIFSALVVGGIAVGVGLGVFLIQPEKGKTETMTPLARKAQAPGNSAMTRHGNSNETPAAASAGGGAGSSGALATPAAPAQARGDSESGVAPEARLGIPLASISDADGKSDPAGEPIPVIALPEIPPQNAGANPPPPAQEAAAEGIPDLTAINAIIQDAKVEKVETIVRPQDPLPYNAVRVPGLKVKGIIYFGKDHPANYILVASLQNVSQKMKVGEEISGATLKEVQPSFAVFSYQGKTAQMRIGE